MEDNTAGEMIIRKMTGADLAQVVEIDSSSFSLPWPASSFKFELERNPSSRCWVAENTDASGAKHLVAMAVVWLIVDEVHIATIAVHPGSRRLKIGQKLLSHLLESAAQEGAKFAFLEVRERNQAARALYQKFGFTEEGRRPGYYSDTHEDAILMNLDRLKPGMFDSFE